MFAVARCTDETLDDWVGLRHALWPQAPLPDLRAEAAASLAGADRTVAFLARDAGAAVVGFAEASVRRDYVNGCETSPVAFLEGIYVRPDWRRRGVARLLIRSVEEWAMVLGCSELASDAGIRNQVSQRMHRALGFEETERVVFYRRRLVRT